MGLVSRDVAELAADPAYVLDDDPGWQPLDRGVWERSPEGRRRW